MATKHKFSSGITNSTKASEVNKGTQLLTVTPVVVFEIR